MAFPTTGVLDTFTGAAAADANFTIIDGGTSFTGVNLDGSGAGVAPSPTTKFAWAYWNPATYGPDSECYVTVTNVGTASNAIRMLARVNGVGATTWTGYFIQGNLFTAATWTIQRHDSGASVTLATSGATQTIAAGDSIGIEIIGTVINAKYKSGAGAWTTFLTYDTVGDATKYTTSGRIAIEFGLKTSKIDNFGGGTVVASGPTLPATINGVATVTANVAVNRKPLVPVCTGVATVTANVAVTRKIVPVCTGIATVSANVVVSRKVVPVSNGVAIVVASVQTGTATRLANVWILSNTSANFSMSYN